MKNKLIKLFSISINKTILFNFKFIRGFRKFLFPIHVFRGIRFARIGSRKEVWISPRVKKIEIGCPGSFRISRTGFWNVSKDSRVEFLGGNIYLSCGIQLYVGSKAKLKIGNNFKINSNSMIICSNSIDIGDDVACGWENEFLDGDGHSISKNGQVLPKTGKISIGNHVWIASRCCLLKGASVPNNTVIAFGAVISKLLNEQNSIYGLNNKRLSSIDNWYY